MQLEVSEPIGWLRGGAVGVSRAVAREGAHATTNAGKGAPGVTPTDLEVRQR